MNNTTVVALLVGFGAICVYALAGSVLDSRNVYVSVGATGAIYFAAGIFFAWFRPTANWLWGLLIPAPIFGVFLFSMAFTGIFTRFWDSDVPIVLTAIVTPCIGVILGGKVTRNFASSSMT